MSGIHAPLDWQDELRFGKYKGKTVGEVADEDAPYLFWMMNNTDVRFKEHVAEHLDKECGQ